MAAEVLHAVEETFRVSLPLQTLLGGASVADLAATIEDEILHPVIEVTTDLQPDSTQEHRGLLSENQAALWFLSQLAPDSAAANVSVLLHFSEDVNASLLKQGLEQLGEQHATLRTTYETQQGVPVQRIHECLPLGWTIIDGSTWDWAHLRQMALEAAAIPFDLQHGPLWRASLYQRQDDTWLLLVAHHIAVDGWSMMQLVKDLKRHYESVQTGSTSMPDGSGTRPVPYSDFVTWHRSLLDSVEGQRLRRYWKERLAGELPTYDILYDRPQTTVEPSRYAWHQFHIEAALAERLKTFAQAEGTTLYAVCLAALQVLMYRYTNQEDTAIVTPVFGRSRSRFAADSG